MLLLVLTGFCLLIVYLRYCIVNLLLYSSLEYTLLSLLYTVLYAQSYLGFIFTFITISVCPVSCLSSQIWLSQLAPVLYFHHLFFWVGCPYVLPDWCSFILTCWPCSLPFIYHLLYYHLCQAS